MLAHLAVYYRETLNPFHQAGNVTLVRSELKYLIIIISTISTLGNENLTTIKVNSIQTSGGQLYRHYKTG